MKQQKMSNPGLSRRQFIGRTATAVAAFSVVPRHVLGGPKFVAPSEKINIAIIGCGGQGRTNMRALFNHPDAQIIAVADPIESENLDAFYYKGNGGPPAGEGGNRKALRREDAELQGGRLRGFPRDAGEGEGHRRHPLRHARSSARLRLRDRDAAGQTCLLRKAAHPQRLGGAPGGQSGQGNRRGDPVGQPGALGRLHPADLRDDLGWGDWRCARGPRLDQRQPLEQEHYRRPAPGGAGPQRGELGFVAGAAGNASLQLSLHAGHLAGFLGLRHGAHWGLLLPQF